MSNVEEYFLHQDVRGTPSCQLNETKTGLPKFRTFVEGVREGRFYGEGDVVDSSVVLEPEDPWVGQLHTDRNRVLIVK